MPLPDDYTGEDFYCDVALRFPQLLDVVLEDDRVLAYHHTRPFWPVHVVVVAKRHLASLTAVGHTDEADLRALAAAVQQVAAQIEQKYGAARVLTNLGHYHDSKHLHIHVASGVPLAPSVAG